MQNQLLPSLPDTQVVYVVKKKLATVWMNEMPRFQYIYRVFGDD